MPYLDEFRVVMPRKTWKSLETSLPPSVYQKDQIVYSQGEPADRFYYLVSGQVKIYLSSESGMEKTLTLLEPGQIFGEAAFFDQLPRVSSAKTLSRSQIIPITRQNLTFCFSQDPDLAFCLLEYLSRTIRMLSAQVDNMAFLQADKRIARLLVQLCSASPEKTIRCTHEELGNLAGVSRVTVSRILREFSRKGWLQTDYGSLHILSAEDLYVFSES